VLGGGFAMASVEDGGNQRAIAVKDPLKENAAPLVFRMLWINFGSIFHNVRRKNGRSEGRSIGGLMISGFVIAYNAEPTIETCLRSLSFVDEIVVIDKSSTDATNAIASRYADRVIVVPWSLMGTGLPGNALPPFSHEFVVDLGQDEFFNVEAIHWIRNHLETSDSDVFFFPRRNYLLGRHDERAHNWPEFQLRAFRRGTVEMPTTIHSQYISKSTKVYQVPISSGACIHHLGIKSIHHYVEGANRYTSAPDRNSGFEVDENVSLDAFCHERMSYWVSQAKSKDEFVVAYAMLRAVYCIIDRLKRWETSNNLDGERETASVCARWQAIYDELGLPKK